MHDRTFLPAGLHNSSHDLWAADNKTSFSDWNPCPSGFLFIDRALLFSGCPVFFVAWDFSGSNPFDSLSQHVLQDPVYPFLFLWIQSCMLHLAYRQRSCIQRTSMVFIFVCCGFIYCGTDVTPEYLCRLCVLHWSCIDPAAFCPIFYIWFHPYVSGGGTYHFHANEKNHADQFRPAWYVAARFFIARYYDPVSAFGSIPFHNWWCTRNIVLRVHPFSFIPYCTAAYVSVFR